MFQLPLEIRHTRDHIWILMEDEFIGICGVSDQYQHNLETIAFVEFPEVDMEVKIGEIVARVESIKDIFDIKSPVSGRITEVNTELEINPGLINSDPYGDGWIFKLEAKEPNEFRELITEDEYVDYLESEGDI